MPTVVGGALLVAILRPLAFGQEWGTWIYRALALLLIGCPCALVIEAAAATTHVAFDKTGTLTNRRPVVTALVPVAGTERDVLSVAAAVETGRIIRWPGRS